MQEYLELLPVDCEDDENALCERWIFSKALPICIDLMLPVLSSRTNQRQRKDGNNRFGQRGC